MKTGILGFVLGCLLSSVAVGMGQEQPRSSNSFLRLLANGPWWDSLSPDTKITFVDGYTTAMSRVNQTANSVCGQTMKNLKPGDQFDADMKTAISLCELAKFFDFKVDAIKLTSGLDDFYGESRNTRIPIDFALEYERDKLKGDASPNALEEKLTGWRNIVNK